MVGIGLDRSVRSFNNKLLSLSGLMHGCSYDVTGQRKYLRIAESIFEDMAKAYGTTPCGGLWWSKVSLSECCTLELS